MVMQITLQLEPNSIAYFTRNYSAKQRNAKCVSYGSIVDCVSRANEQHWEEESKLLKLMKSGSDANRTQFNSLKKLIKSIIATRMAHIHINYVDRIFCFLFSHIFFLLFPICYSAIFLRSAFIPSINKKSDIFQRNTTSNYLSENKSVGKKHASTSFILFIRNESQNNIKRRLIWWTVFTEIADAKFRSCTIKKKKLHIFCIRRYFMLTNTMFAENSSI